MDPIDPALLAEINELAARIDPVVSRRPRRPTDDLAEFRASRRALLARHLGQEPPESIEPVTVIGDSNTMFFAGADHLRFIRYRRCGLLRPRYINRGLDLLPCFRTIHLGPSTAWKAAEHGSSTRAREKLELLVRRDLKPGQRVMLSFGEIDCRIHMPKAVLGGKPLKDTTVATGRRLLGLATWLRDAGMRVALWGIPQIIPREENDPNAPLPPVGSLELRTEITYTFIETMDELAGEAGIPHVALAGTFHPPAEPMPPETFHDEVHLSQVLMPHALRALVRGGVVDLPVPPVQADPSAPSPA